MPITILAGDMKYRDSQGNYQSLEAIKGEKGDPGSKGDTGDPAPASAVVPAVEDWLEENITNPDSPPLDRSLSSSSAAAPADLVGNLKNDLNELGEREKEKTESISAEFTANKVIIANSEDHLYGRTNNASSQYNLQCSDFVNIEGYEKIEITMLKYVSASSIGIVFYSDNVEENIPDNCVAGYTINSGASSDTYETRIFDIPAGAKYFRTTYKSIYDFSCTGSAETLYGKIMEDIGDLSDLDTTDKSDLVGAVNEVNAKAASVGDLTELETSEKDNLVDAVNEVNTKASAAVESISENIQVTFSSDNIIIAKESHEKYGKTHPVSSSYNYEYSGFTDVEKYKRISITMLKLPSASDAGIVFYSDNVEANIPDNCVAGYTINGGASSTTYETRTFDIPAGAKYFRTTYSTAFSFSCVGDVETLYGKLMSDIGDKTQLETSEKDNLVDAVNEVNAKVMEGNSAVPDDIVEIKVADFDDGVKTDDQIIASALAFASSYSKKCILFDTRNWNISEAILLEADTKVIIDGVKIKQDDGTFDNVFRGKNFVVDEQNPNMFAQSVSDIWNISIIGKNGASIEGPDVNATIYNPYSERTVNMVGDAYGWRTYQIYLCNCNGIEISGLTITKTRGWAISFEFCRNGHIHDLAYNTINTKNGDGIDLRIGCHHFNIHDITGKTEDDTIACTALYPTYNNSAYNPQTSEAMFPMVASRTGQSLEDVDRRLLDVHDIVISNIYTGGKNHAVICLCANGLQVYNVGINNVEERETSTRYSVVKVYTGYAATWASGSYSAGDLHNISAGTIVADGAGYAFECNCTVADVYLNKLVQSDQGEQIYSISDDTGITITNTEPNPE